MATRTFGFLNATRQYLKSLNAQAIGLPSYGQLIQWDNFIRILSPRPTNASMIQPRNLSAYYANDPTALILDGSNNVILWEDWSGNSATNCLCLNGVAGNYASSSNATPIQITGDIDVRAQAGLPTWIPAPPNCLIGKTSSASTRSFYFEVGTNGFVTLSLSQDGLTPVTVLSSIATSFGANQVGWVRATWRQSDGRVQFFTSPDGIIWTQLGTNQSIAIASIFNSSSPLEIGARNSGTSNPFSGRIYRAQLFNGIPVGDGGSGATLVFDADFSKVIKLATSFTESSTNAATVTVNSTGDTGARVAGERDLYQGTSTKRPAYAAAVGRQRLSITFDGVDDYLKAPSFALAQPETIYFVGSKPTWVSLASVFDGNAADSMTLQQAGTTPQIRLFAGSITTVNSDWVLTSRAILTSVFNGALSYVQVNRGAIPTLASAGAANGAGFTLAARPTPDRFANIVAQEIAIYSEAHSAQTVNQIQGYLASKYSIGL